MKLFGVILLAGYFLARENKSVCQAQLALKRLIKSWAIYLMSAGLTVFVGLFLNEPAARMNPLVLFLTACLPVIIFKGRPTCMIAGAATAFCVLRFLPDINRVVIALLCVEMAVLSVGFLYLGARVRMAQLYLPAMAQKTPGRLLILFALAVLLSAVYQKTIQLYTL